MARERRADDADAARDRIATESLLPIAEALRDAIDAKLSGEGASGSLDVEAAHDAALSAVAEAIIKSRLDGQRQRSVSGRDRGRAARGEAERRGIAAA